MKSVILLKHSAGVQLQSRLVTPGRFNSTCCISRLPNCTHVEQNLGRREGVRFSYLYRLNTKYCTLLKLSLFSLDCYCHRLLYWMPSLNVQNVLRMLTSCSISITTFLGILNEKAYYTNIYECPVWSQMPNLMPANITTYTVFTLTPEWDFIVPHFFFINMESFAWRVAPTAVVLLQSMVQEEKLLELFTNIVWTHHLKVANGSGHATSPLGKVLAF